MLCLPSDQDGKKNIFMDSSGHRNHDRNSTLRQMVLRNAK